MRNHNDDTIKTPQWRRATQKNIPFTLFERVVCERELETEQNCNILTRPLLWPSAFLSRSPGLLKRGPGAKPLWLLGFSTASYLQLVWSPNSSIGGPEGPFSRVLFSLQHHFPTVWSPNWLNFLCTELYYSSTLTQFLPITCHRNMHFRCLWNGMFDRHRAEITVMQFTGHSLPVHQFVTVPWDFNPVPYCQPSLPTPMEYVASAVFGMACLAGSEVNILHSEGLFRTPSNRISHCFYIVRTSWSQLHIRSGIFCLLVGVVYRPCGLKFVYQR